MRQYLQGLWLLVAALALAGPAVAADPHDHGAASDPHSREIDAALAEVGYQGDPHTAHEVVAALEKAGFEVHKKSDILAFSADLAIWTVVVFILLLIILRALAWNPILDGLQQREKKILDARNDAIAASEEASRVRDELQAKLAAAGDEVRGMLDQARKDAEKVRESMVAQARNDAQTERDRALREIETARDVALQSITERSVELASLISAKAIRRSINGDDHRRLVDEALAELTVANPEGRV
jgi:F-type H+-transporting ATPase subunit b